MIRRLRRFLSAVHENRTLRIENANLRYDLDKQKRIVAGLNVDIAIIGRDRDQLLRDKYLAMELGRLLTTTDKRPVVH